MPRVKITEPTLTIAAFLCAICATQSFTEQDVDQLCQRLEIDPFQLQELFARAQAPAADIPVENDAMPAAWYDNNVQLSRLLLELNDVLELGRSQWEAMLSAAGLSETDAAEVFGLAMGQLEEGRLRYRN